MASILKTPVIDTSIQPARRPATENTLRQGAFWSRWVLANAAGELAGLGTVTLIAWALVSTMKDQQTFLQHVLFAIALIAAGALEGVLVGAAQAWALTPRLAGFSRREWIQATFLGSLLAWVLGMLPSTLMAAAAESSGQAPTEPGPAVTYALAALLGAVAGVLLSFFQWRVLRAHLPGAAGWMAANAAAWALGMPLVFLGADLASRGGAIPVLVATCAVTLAGTGALVGAVHGLWLIWKTQPGRSGGS